MDYKQKLLDPRWQRKRLETLQRDDFCCQRCLDKESTLHVHHKFYWRNTDPWDYPAACLITLCADCHEMETENLRFFTAELIQDLKERGFMSLNFEALLGAIANGELDGFMKK